MVKRLLTPLPKPSLRAMRKPIALTVTGLLLTGAFQANADEVTVVESPENLIHVNQIQIFGGENDGDPASTLSPSLMGSFDPNLYVLPVEAVVEGLVELTVCLYDDSEVTAENTVSDICYDDLLLTEKMSTSFMAFNGIPATRSDIAFASFVPDYDPYVPEGGDWTGDSWEIPIANRGFDGNKPSQPGIGQSSFSLESTIGTQTVAADSVYHINFVVTPDQRLQQGTDWKVRVSAVYDGVTDRVEPTDSNTYEVPYFSGFHLSISQRRGQVDYEDLTENSSVTKPSLVTGKYYANGESFIAMEAENLFTKVGSTETIPFKSSTPDEDENALSLACTPESGGSTLFVDNTEPKTFIGSVAATNNQSNPTLPRDAPNHACTLSVGSGFELGTYSTDIFVSIGERVIPPQPPEA